MDNAKIGKFIAEMRKSAGLSQTELAKELNISNRTVSKWETGDGLLDIATVPQIAQFFGITVDELLAGERKPSAAQETARNLLQLRHSRRYLNRCRFCIKKHSPKMSEKKPIRSERHYRKNRRNGAV